jgi:hypothetical protein
MGMIDIHREARKDIKSTVLHEFKLRYKMHAKVIYGFVEGKEDPCFYRGFIENSIPHDWKVELWPSGNKDSVYAVYSKFDWKKFNRNQILFFVDRDLSDFVNEENIQAQNIYVTENYSIENDVVNKNTCERVIREICGFSELEYNASDKILNLFEEQLELFQKALIPVMSNIIFWRKNGLNACLNDIYMKHIFSIKKGKVKLNSRPKNKSDVVTYIHEQCNLSLCDQVEINKIARKFEEDLHFKRFIRGKYLLWFIVEFCNSIHRDCISLDCVSILKQPKMVTNLSQSNGIVQIAPRCKMPSSLKLFFEGTLSKYLEIENAA